MKNILLAVLVLIGLQTQAQINYCDSISYTVIPGTQTLTVIGNASSLVNLTNFITWEWTVCNFQYCNNYTGPTHLTFPLPQGDTVKVCYDVTISIMGVTYFCTSCDSLVYDVNSYS